MPRKFFVGGNWKCNGTVKAMDTLIAGLNAAVAELPGADVVDVLVAPCSLYLGKAMAELDKRYMVSAQNCYLKKGAFTGEIACEFLPDFGINWTLLGHSERRHIFGETDALLAEKTAAALAAGLNIVYCIGELKEERLADKTAEVCEAQLAALAGAIKNKEDWKKIVIAYEPVWAIGTGLTATPEQAQEAHVVCRKYIAEHVGADVAEDIVIMYGGSVNDKNAEELAKKPDVDGFLVGGASLDAGKFSTIIKAVKAKL